MIEKIVSALNAAINKYMICRNVEVATMIVTNNMITGENKFIDANNVQEAISILRSYHNTTGSIKKTVVYIMLQRLIEYASIVI